jgi:hypothetical protein
MADEGFHFFIFFNCYAYVVLFCSGSAYMVSRQTVRLSIPDCSFPVKVHTLMHTLPRYLLGRLYKNGWLLCFLLLVCLFGDFGSWGD